MNLNTGSSLPNEIQNDELFPSLVKAPVNDKFNKWTPKELTHEEVLSITNDGISVINFALSNFHNNIEKFNQRISSIINPETVRRNVVFSSIHKGFKNEDFDVIANNVLNSVSSIVESLNKDINEAKEVVSIENGFKWSNNVFKLDVNETSANIIKGNDIIPINSKNIDLVSSFTENILNTISHFRKKIDAQIDRLNKTMDLFMESAISKQELDIKRAEYKENINRMLLMCTNLGNNYNNKSKPA